MSKQVLSSKGVFLDLTGIIDVHALIKYLIDLVHNMKHNDSKKILFYFGNDGEITIAYDKPATIEQLNSMVSYYIPSKTHTLDDNMSTRGVGRMFIPYAFPGCWHVVTQTTDGSDDLACASMNTKEIMTKLNNPDISDTELTSSLSTHTAYAEKFEAYADIETKKPKYIVDYFQNKDELFPFTPKLIMNSRRVVLKTNLKKVLKFKEDDSPFTTDFWKNVRYHLAINTYHLIHSNIPIDEGGEPEISIFYRFPDDEKFENLSSIECYDAIGWHSRINKSPQLFATIYKAKKDISDLKVLEGGRPGDKKRKKQENHTVKGGSHVFYIESNDGSDPYWMKSNDTKMMILDVKPSDEKELTSIAKQTMYFNLDTFNPENVPSNASTEGIYAGLFLMIQNQITGSIATSVKFDEMFRGIPGEENTRYQLRAMLELTTKDSKDTLARIEKVKYDSSVSEEGKHIVEIIAKCFVNRHLKKVYDVPEDAITTGAIYTRIVDFCKDGTSVVKFGITKQKQTKKRSSSQPADKNHPWEEESSGLNMPSEPFEIPNICRIEVFEQEVLSKIESKSKDATKNIKVSYTNIKLREYFKMPIQTLLEIIDDIKTLSTEIRFAVEDSE